MRLLDTRRLWLQDFPDSSLPSYAILSHTWSSHEVEYQDLTRHSRLQAHPGFAKVQGACRKAAADGHRYIWIDSCCIDKSSSAELSTAINSMFKWYKSACVCYVLLEDFDVTTPWMYGRLVKCRWFFRGWTLQELVAPHHVEFYDFRWREIGTKLSLTSSIAAATGISEGVLRNDVPLASCTVAQKMSWASGRNTTRGEDVAYCLLGLFDVHIPLLYGEGRQRAFERLQEEIMRRTDDVSLLLWLPHSVPGQDPAAVGSLAPCPDYFCRKMSCTECGEPFNYARLRMLQRSDREQILSRLVGLPEHQLIRRDFGMVSLSGGRKLQLYCHLLSMPSGSSSQPAPVVLLNVAEDTTPPHLFAMHLERSVLTNMNAQYRIVGFQTIKLDELPMLTGSLATISIFRGLQPCIPSWCLADVQLRLISRDLWGARTVQKRSEDDPQRLYGALVIPIGLGAASHRARCLTIVYSITAPGANSDYRCSMAADWSTSSSPSPRLLLYRAMKYSENAFVPTALAEAFEEHTKYTDRLTICSTHARYIVRMRPDPDTRRKDNGAVADGIRKLYSLEVRKECKLAANSSKPRSSQGPPIDMQTSVGSNVRVVRGGLPATFLGKESRRLLRWQNYVAR